ncbi:amino acid transporter [Choiromyces venosus 120613-1]|uniref:Amino acid transporter n=1 Tax=Choiromyces venosus 120613-1 TaxID=1336337 RepID=A0A3N4JYH3_9PEZI|nr:amino acid transporter [Choiromyces venosus 120613-1]
MTEAGSPKKSYAESEAIGARTGLLSGNDEESSLEIASIVEIPKVAGNSHRLTFFDGFSLLVSFQIGSGLFSSPSQINNNVASPGAAILVWVGTGLLAWAGAACFAELGAAIPVNGGMQEYLQYIYGDFAALLVSFTWIAAVKPCSMAILSLIFAEYWTRAIFGAGGDTFWLDKSLAIGALASLTLFNSISTKASANLNGMFFFIKLSTVGMIAVITIFVMFTGLNTQGSGPSTDWKTRDWFANRPTEADGHHVDWNSLTTWESMGYYSAALWAGTWGYGGWDNANFVAGEMRNTARDLPRAVNLALPTVICCFILTNLCYYIILPWDIIGATDTIAVTVGLKTLGPAGGLIFAVLVSIACAGSLNANVFATGRLTASAANKGHIPRFWGVLGWKSPSEESSPTTPTYGTTNSPPGSIQKSPTSATWRTPLRAMILNSLLCCTYILLGNFSSLVTFIGITEYTSYLVTISGVIYLRYTQPELSRAYKPPIWTPVLFLMVCSVLVLRGMIFAPAQAGILAVYVCLVSLYYRYSWKGRQGVRI